MRWSSIKAYVAIFGATVLFLVGSLGGALWDLVTGLREERRF